MTTFFSPSPNGFDDLEIGHKEIHLYCGKNSDMQDFLHRTGEMLSPIELQRAEKFHFQNDQNRYLIRHGVLRMLIGGYLAIDPKEIQFGVNRFGKPFIENTHQKGSFEFNMSHSNEMVLFAFALDRRVGVDIEYVKPIEDMDGIIESNFSSDEIAEFATLPINKRDAAFYHCWTQKEAFVKAFGEGLSRGLDQFDVSVSPDLPASLKRTIWDREETGRWSLTAIHSVPGYAAALAVEGSGLSLRYKELIL